MSKKATIYGIKKWIKEIKEIGNDDFEVAHQEEDSLMEWALEAIAKGVDNPEELAKEALKVKKLEYDKYYA